MMQLICVLTYLEVRQLFGSIVYSQAIVHKHQNFLKVVVHLIIIIIDQCNPTVY